MELWISVNNPEPITLQTWRPVNIIAHVSRRPMPTLALIALALLASHEVRLEWSPLELSTKHREISQGPERRRPLLATRAFSFLKAHNSVLSIQNLVLVV